MKAFHGDPAIKERYLARVRAHRAADELVRGQYWEDGKGCAVGCTIHSDDHGAYERELGIPREIAQLEDGIFEGLPNDLAISWPEEFLAAIQVGADLSLVWPRFALWLLADPDHGARRRAEDDTRAVSAIDDVALLFAEWIGSGIRPEESRWAAARDAAGNAARDAANDATWHATWHAAWAAGWAAAGDTRWAAARAAARAAAGAAGWIDWWIAARATLLELLASAPVTAAT